MPKRQVPAGVDFVVWVISSLLLFELRPSTLRCCVNFGEHIVVWNESVGCLGCFLSGQKSEHHNSNRPVCWFQLVGSSMLIPVCLFQFVGSNLLVPVCWVQFVGSSSLYPVRWFQFFCASSSLVPARWFQFVGSRLLLSVCWFLFVSASLNFRFLRVRF